MSDIIAPPDNALAFLKADLGYFNTAIPADLESNLQGLIIVAQTRLVARGVTLAPGNVDDDQLIAAYAAWLHRNKTGAAMPESLSREIKTRQVDAATS